MMDLFNWDVWYYVVLVVGTFLVALLLSILLRKLTTVFIRKYSSVIKSDPTNFSFLKNAIPFIIFSVATIFIFMKIPFLRSLGTALFAGAGILAAIVGFASQKAFANIISGVFILMFKPFRVGDTLEISNSRKGIVEEITLRHTIIKDYENRRIIIPNSQISDDILINSSISDESIRKFVEFGISYDADVDKAIAIIREEAINHPFCKDNRTPEQKASNDPVVLVRMVAHSDFSINLRAYVWTASNDEAFALQCDLLYSVKKRFDHEGIEIPFPYRTIVFKKDTEKKPAEIK
jgi:small-conductance mechanosensitive channel